MNRGTQWPKHIARLSWHLHLRQQRLTKHSAYVAGVMEPFNEVGATLNAYQILKARFFSIYQNDGIVEYQDTTFWLLPLSLSFGLPSQHFPSQSIKLGVRDLESMFCIAALEVPRWMAIQNRLVREGVFA